MWWFVFTNAVAVAIAAAAAAAGANEIAGPCVHVLMPCFKCEETVRELLFMVHRNAQHHWCVDVVAVVDWANMDAASEPAIRATCKTYSLSCTVIPVPTRLGPAHSKFIGFEYVSTAYGANDLVMLVDADDNLADDLVVETVVSRMLAAGAWVSTGRIVGPYAEQCATEWPLQTPMRKAAWSFCHPRTLRVGLVANLSKSDFQFNGEWLEKVTDRSWLYAAVDVATRKRFIKVTDRPLVLYTSRPDNTESRVSFEYKQQALSHVSTTPKRPPFTEVHIVSVVYNREKWLMRFVKHNVLNQYESLQLHNLTPVVHFVCQTNAVARPAQEACAVLDALHNIECNVEVHAFNTGPWQRYVYMRRVYMQRLVDFFVMIDDDLIFTSNNGLLRVWHQRAEKGMACWYGKVFGRNDDYWTSKYRTNDMRGAMNAECRQITKFDYCGAGLAIIDAQFWATFEAMAARTPHQYRSIEDVASSKYLADIKWKRRRLFVDVTDMNYGDDGKVSKPSGLWSASFMRARKSDFFASLKNEGWVMQHNESVLSSCLSRSRVRMQH